MGVILCLFLFSQYAYPHLAIYPGARAIGMGGANVAIADDAYSCFYNPAGIAFQDGLDLSFEPPSIQSTPYFPYFLYGNYWACAGACKIYKNLALGIFGSGFYNHDTIGAFFSNYLKYSDFSSGVSVSDKISGCFSFGLNVKVLSNSYRVRLTRFINPWTPYYEYIDSTKYSYATDFGILSNLPLSFGKLHIGFTVQNLGPKVQYMLLNRKQTLPTSCRLGFSCEIGTALNENKMFGLFQKSWRVIIAYDINQVIYRDPLDNELILEDLKYSAGIEARLFDLISVRIGCYDDQRSAVGDEPNRRLTCGAGLNFKYFRIDVADDIAFSWLPPYEHRARFSFSLNLDDSSLLR